MHPNSQHMMAVANSFWPFPYPLKSYDMALHPAFLQTAYRGVPTIPYGQQFESTAQTQQQQPQPSSPSPPQKSSAKFSIDAILNRDKVKDVPNREINTLTEQNRFTNFVKYAKDDDDAIKRRHQRLLEASHPYLSHHSSLQEKTFLQKHLQTTYKHYTDAVRSPDKDKKTSPCGESWSSKSAKGKRVRTIFTPEQLERMEAEFERQQYMVGTERYYLASSLNLTEAQVKVWFQNRRIKWRKQHLEQQQAKLKSLNIYRQAETASDSESEDDVTSGNRDLVPERDLITERDLISVDRDRMTERDLIGERSHDSIADPFHSPKESRCTQ